MTNLPQTSALAGLRILDMTQYEAGTSCSQALAWLGADVVKVEPPGFGDPGRGGARGEGNAPYFINWNSNKRSIVLNLKEPEGRQLLLDMVPHYDVFVENYGPGVVERLDIGYEVMKQANPGIIYAQLKGFGTSGPYSDYKCFDMVAQATAGAFSVTGEADGPPMRPGATVGDSGTGVQLALAITAAYVQKLQTGQGQHIEISMQEAMTYYMRTQIAIGADWGNAVAPRSGNGPGATTNLYPCAPSAPQDDGAPSETGSAPGPNAPHAERGPNAPHAERGPNAPHAERRPNAPHAERGPNDPRAERGPNDYVFIMCSRPHMWDALAAAIGQPELSEDPRFNTDAARLENAADLYEIVAAWTSQQTKHEAMRILGEAGVPVGKNFDTRDLFHDEHLTQRGFVHELHHPEHGAIRLLGWAPRMSASSVPIQRAPLMGEHSDEVLAADLGLTPDRLTELHEAGVVS
jgi:formyl-CoA transferase